MKKFVIGKIQWQDVENGEIIAAGVDIIEGIECPKCSAVVLDEHKHQQWHARSSIGVDFLHDRT